MNHLKVQSISDIITNSSSEVFLIDMDKKYEDFWNIDRIMIDGKNYYQCLRNIVHEFNTIEDIKNYIDDGGKFNDLSIFSRDRENGELYYDDLLFEWKMSHSFEEPSDEIKDKLWEKCNNGDTFKPLIGKAMIISDDFLDENGHYNDEVQSQIRDIIAASDMNLKIGCCG